MIAAGVGGRELLEDIRLLYCAWLAGAVLVQLRGHVRYVRRRGAERRLPRVLNVVPLPALPAEAVAAVGLGLAACLAVAALVPAAGAGPWLVAAAGASLLYFAQVIDLPAVRRKPNTVPIFLLLLGAASFVPAAAPEAPAIGRLVRWTMQLVVAQMYFSSGVMKLRLAGWRWADGATLRTALVRAHLGDGNRAALWLARRRGAVRLAATLMLGFDLTFWLIIPFPNLAWAFLPLGIGFHVATAALLRIHYWIYVVPAYLVFVRW
ncbi:MAG: hypothetical protein RLZZ15_2180 [Verrucomicrobiota bacterium]